MPKVEQPELAPFERTQFAVGKIESRATKIIEAVRRIEGEANLPFVRLIEKLAVGVIKCSREAVAQQSVWAAEMHYRHLRDSDDKKRQAKKNKEVKRGTRHN